MFRIFAFLCLLASSAALTVAALGFAAQLDDPALQDITSVAQYVPAAAQVAPEKTVDALELMPIFGTAQPDATAPDVVSDPVPGSDYVLRGIMASDRMRWAVLNGPDGEVFVREGDALDQGLRVARIETDHVVLGLADGTLTVGFPLETAPQVTALARATTAGLTPQTSNDSGKAPVTIRSVNMSQEDVFAMIRAAEIQYAATTSR